MPANLPVLAGNNTPKFLVGSEKVARGAVAVGGGTIAAVGIYYALPYVIHFAEMGIEAGLKLLVLGGLLGVMGLILALVLNPSVQTAVWYWYMGLVDSIAFKIVQIDPIKRVKAYVSHYLEPMGARAQQLLDRAVGRQTSAQQRTETTRQQLKDATDRAEYLLRHGSPDGGRTWTDSKLRSQFSVTSQKIATLKSALTRLEKRQKFQDGCVIVLQNLQEVINSYIEVTRFNVDMMVQEYESAEEMAEGANETRGMLGASSKTQFYQMAAQNIQDQTNQWMAEVQGVMNAIQVQIEEGKISDAISEEALIRELTDRVGTMTSFAEGQKQLAQGGEAILLSNAKSKVLEAVPVEGSTSSDPAPSTDRFRKLLPPRQ
jgi:hypothetical protein